MKELSLMDRQESKFLIKSEAVCQLLKGLNKDYQVFSINDKNISTYITEYYDTQDLDFYRAHLVGKSNRMKVRIRNYVDSQISFIEIKKKNNKGRTTKNRREYVGDFPKVLDINDIIYVKDNGFDNDSNLLATLSVYYKRITLVSPILKERVTMDLDLSFTDNNQSKRFDDVCIIEVKQLKKSVSPIFDRLVAIQNVKEPISKYCLGLLGLRPSLPHNLFKTKIYHFNKLRNNSL